MTKGERQPMKAPEEQQPNSGNVPRRRRSGAYKTHYQREADRARSEAKYTATLSAVKCPAINKRERPIKLTGAAPLTGLASSWRDCLHRLFRPRTTRASMREY